MRRPSCGQKLTSSENRDLHLLQTRIVRSYDVGSTHGVPDKNLFALAKDPAA
jgi:hypothetical protein